MNININILFIGISKGFSNIYFTFVFVCAKEKKIERLLSIENPLDSARWGRLWSIEKRSAGGWQRVKLKVNGEREF